MTWAALSIPLALPYIIPAPLEGAAFTALVSVACLGAFSSAVLCVEILRHAVSRWSKWPDSTHLFMVLLLFITFMFFMYYGYLLIDTNA